MLNFTSAGGQPRQQIFMLNVGGSSATVTGWTSPEFDGSDSSYPYQCATVEPFYIQAASWSPTCFGMDQPRPVRRPHSYWRVFIAGPAKV